MNLITPKLADDENLFSIPLSYPENLIRMLGYDGDSKYVAIWVNGETDAPFWFDGKAGKNILFEAPWINWTTRTQTRFALRSLDLVSDFRELGDALIFDLESKALYAGKLSHVRKKLEQLAETQGLLGPLELLFTQQELEEASANGFTEEQIARLKQSEVHGSTKPSVH